MIGETLDGKYRILRLLGSGGMGAVYEGEELAGGRRVAIKRIAGSLLQQTGSVERFQREAKATSAIATEHIVRVLDAGTDPATKTPYMAMELLQGEDLQHRLDRSGPLEAGAALRIAAQLCVGLGKAHAARIIHRDIKPANVFLARRGEGEIVVKILDFGIAKIRPEPSSDSGSAGLTFTGGMLGTPRYMSPEQARGIKDIDFRTDIWSLGMVLYCSLSGRLPHEGIEAFGDLIMAICSRPPREILEIAPWVRPDVAAVVSGALQLAPRDRFPTAESMLDAIRPLLPDGWDLREELLVSVRPGAVAPDAATVRVERPAAPRNNPAPAWKRAPASPAADETQPDAVVDPGGTTAEAGVTTRDRESPIKGRDGARARARRTAAAVALAATAGLGGFGLHEAWVHVEAPPPAGGQMASVATAPLLVEPPPSGAPLVTPAPALQHVQIAVQPADVSVEVDGKPAEVQSGKVEIAGAPGSVHSVRLFKGKSERRGDVIVTEVGASPAAMELDATKPRVPGLPVTAAGAKAPAGSALVSAPPATAQAAPPPAPRDPLAPSEFR